MWEKGNKFSEAWNFGPNDECCKSVKQILEKISKEWGENFFWEDDDKENPHETSILKLDYKKAKERLGWETKLNINEALEWTINWYKKFLENSNIKEYTKKQIEEFESRQMRKIYVCFLI